MSANVLLVSLGTAAKKTSMSVHLSHVKMEQHAQTMSIPTLAHALLDFLALIAKLMMKTAPPVPVLIVALASMVSTITHVFVHQGE